MLNNCIWRIVLRSFEKFQKARSFSVSTFHFGIHPGLQAIFQEFVREYLTPLHNLKQSITSNERREPVIGVFNVYKLSITVIMFQKSRYEKYAIEIYVMLIGDF